MHRLMTGALAAYVEDLSKLAVSSFGEMEALMDEGNQARTVACKLEQSESSLRFLADALSQPLR